MFTVLFFLFLRFLSFLYLLLSFLLDALKLFYLTISICACSFKLCLSFCFRVAMKSACLIYIGLVLHGDIQCAYATIVHNALDGLICSLFHVSIENRLRRLITNNNCEFDYLSLFSIRKMATVA